MQRLFPPPGAINGCCLVETGRDPGQGRQIDDGVIPEFLPDVGADQQPLETVRIPHRQELLHAQAGADQIINTLGAEHAGNDVGQDNPGDEVRQIDDGLHRLLELHLLDFVQHQREGHGDHDIQNYLGHGDNQCIGQRPLRVPQLPQVLKPLETDPWRIKPAFGRNVILESHDDAHHGHDGEKSQPDVSGQTHQRVMKA